MSVLALLAPLTLLAACGGGALTVTCDPGCPTGFTCTTAGCKADNPLNFDLNVAKPDLSTSCTCGGTTPLCNADGICVACLADADCPKGQQCKVSGKLNVCVPGCVDDTRCPNGQNCCSGLCTDKMADPFNCGVCGTACKATHAAAACVGGVCQGGACQTGWGDCNSDPTDGCETNFGLDPSNCGGCNKACSFAHAKAGCSNTCYIAACDFGFDNCDDDPTNGCEFPVLSDPQNCGACNNVCVPVPHAVPECSFGACKLAVCAAGYADCNSKPDDGCEVNIYTDTKNCGRCGAACPGAQVCINGECTCKQCKFPNAKTTCDKNNACVFDTCLPGFADCNKMLADGCEVNIQYDAGNCNACGVACGGLTPFCNNYVCSDIAPIDTYSDMFTQNIDPTVMQCMNWTDYLTKTLDPKKVYTQVTINGSNDMTGVTCMGKEANDICQAMQKNNIGNQFTVQCNGRTWAVGPSITGNSVEVDSPQQFFGFATCDSPGYTIRPCSATAMFGLPGAWGGVNTSTCFPPTQTITISCSL